MKFLRMLFQGVGNPELVLPTTRSYSYGQELVLYGHSSCHNCMNCMAGKTQFWICNFLEKIQLFIYELMTYIVF